MNMTSVWCLIDVGFALDCFVEPSPEIHDFCIGAFQVIAEDPDLEYNSLRTYTVEGTDLFYADSLYQAGAGAIKVAKVLFVIYGLKLLL